ncbi:HTH_48 domain-containing protein [Trichonephila clavipes]|nr:HTH_48 domain-containing protein [Trichonephila clavipes]
MEVTHVAVLRERNAIECHTELVEALGNNTLPYRTVARWIVKFQQGRGQPVMRNIRDDRSVCGPTWHAPSSSISWRR